MVKINENYSKLSQNYLFAEIARRVAQYKAENPDKRVISLGIGDVTRPLAPSVIKAMHKAVDDEASSATFHGYGPEQGYAFLRDKIAQFDFQARGIDIESDEIFVSDGAKSDTGNITDMLADGNVIGLTDPVYPVYIDSNVMSGHAGEPDASGGYANILRLPCTEENAFSPEIPRNRKLNLIYLCYPNNPTGTTLTRAQLTAWVDYALECGSLLLFDAAYEAFITDDTPHSIYEIPGAERCAIEFRSFSKTAGFTGVRLGYTVVPKSLAVAAASGMSLNAMWRRRQTTKFNGASYISQRGAEAIYSEQGRREVEANIEYYHANARLMKSSLEQAGLTVYGGVNSPYLWVKTPSGATSWAFFDRLLHDAALVSTPGAGFGPSGEGFIRLTAFGSHDDAEEAMKRLEKLL